MSPDRSLQDLQRQFVREVLYRESPGLLSQIVANGLDAERRLAIYRNNARETFALALEAAFPLLLRCMGCEEFRSLAWAYQRACPSPAGNLYHVGVRLAGYLEEHVRGTEDEYLIDVARLEWAVQESLVAADGAAALNLSALAEVPADRQVDVRFLLHPSVRLLRTEYAVFGPWEARQAGLPVKPAARDPEYLLVRRLAAGIQLQRLDSGDLDWLSALQRGEPLAGEVEFGSLLVRWVGAGVVTDFTVQDPA